MKRALPTPQTIPLRPQALEKVPRLGLVVAMVVMVLAVSVMLSTLTSGVLLEGIGQLLPLHDEVLMQVQPEALAA